ncbi:hypothetical protein HL653_05040 [Sphingomonas sp. AP4-R1]|uniref:hypothetical protein n=1 Tax=Sphingomonas sp. AP4-R1 TaxID=2735134 RepID=UPI0014937831|nr:hypothetical protein [Sphingomonas sp. AP4-R1]QJU57242.1 hypothetical protein HL653_05040 [Sphingomonas sp. AP4-R1]
MRDLAIRLAKWGGALAFVAALSSAPAESRSPRVKTSNKTAVMNGAGFGAFTPAAADPRLAAAFARSGLGTSNFAGGAFRFTPGTPTKSRAVTVAMRSRVVTKADAARNLQISSDIAPSAYSLGMSVGWKRFAISGDMSRTDGGLMPDGRESADIGFAYYGRRWATKLDLGAERSTDRPPVVGIDQSWSLGLGTTYSLTHNLDVTGGVRYRAQRDQFQSLVDDRRDSQSVYLGTTFRF